MRRATLAGVGGRRVDEGLRWVFAPSDGHDGSQEYGERVLSLRFASSQLRPTARQH